MHIHVYVRVFVDVYGKKGSETQVLGWFWRKEMDQDFCREEYARNPPRSWRYSTTIHGWMIWMIWMVVMIGGDWFVMVNGW